VQQGQHTHRPAIQPRLPAVPLDRQEGAAGAGPLTDPHGDIPVSHPKERHHRRFLLEYQECLQQNHLPGHPAHPHIQEVLLPPLRNRAVRSTQRSDQTAADGLPGVFGDLRDEVPAEFRLVPALPLHADLHNSRGQAGYSCRAIASHRAQGDTADSFQT
jgi:hypothetical protein